MTQPDVLNLLQDLIATAERAGADSADAVAMDGASVSHAWRLGKTERLERSEEGDIGLRVFIGQRQAIVSTTDRRPAGLRDLAERAVAMARVVPEDDYNGLADPAQIATDSSMTLAAANPATAKARSRRRSSSLSDCCRRSGS